jgi:F-type H+-transporting ATPase subunit a
MQIGNYIKIVLFSLLLTVTASAQHGEVSHDTHSAEPKGIKERINEVKAHHLVDSHDFILYSTDAGKHVGFPLPVILWDNGLKVFSSSKFHHGEAIAAVDGSHYKMVHNKIYKADAQGNVAAEHGHPSKEAKVLDFSITRNVIFILLAGLIMFLIFRSLAKSYSKNNGIPTGVGRFLEPIVLYVRDDIAIANIGEKHYKKYMPFLLTVFFFIWILNLLGLTPLGANVTGNIAVTASLALLTYLMTTFTAKKDYWKHIFWMPGVPTPMKIILAPIELLGTIIKPFSLLIRLYANMTAGHVVLMSIIGLMFIFKNWIGSSLSFGLAFGLSLLELLVAALQAYIFTMLSALYFGSASEEHSDH